MRSNTASTLHGYRYEFESTLKVTEALFCGTETFFYGSEALIPGKNKKCR